MLTIASKMDYVFWTCPRRTIPRANASKNQKNPIEVESCGSS